MLHIACWIFSFGSAGWFAYEAWRGCVSMPLARKLAAERRAAAARREELEFEAAARRITGHWL